MKKIFLLLILHFYFARPMTLNPEELLSKMSLTEKVAQLMIVAASANEEKDKELIENWHKWVPEYKLDKNYIEDLIKKYNIGGVIFYGRKATPKDQLELTKYYQSISKNRLFIALDIENSLANRFTEDSTVWFPYAMALGAIDDLDLIYKLGYELGLQLKKIGVHWTFSPVVDVNYNSKNPVINYRSFGSDPEKVSQHAIALMKGFKKAGIMTCAKHFPGHGDTVTDSHHALPIVPHTLQRLEEIELYPFAKLIEAGIDSVMTAHLEVPALEKEEAKPTSLSYSVVTKLLKEKMNFDGLVVIDALGMKGATLYAEPGEEEVCALIAGNDVLLCPVNPVKAIEYIINAIKAGRLTEEQINKKVLKVLKAKQSAFQNEEALSEATDLQTENAKQLKQLLYSKAVTLYKAESSNCFIRYKENQIALILGNADIFSQYLTKNNIPCISKYEDISFDEYNHIIIAINNMNIDFKKNFGISEQTLDIISSLKKLDKIVTVVIFGSPYSIPLLFSADNILIAYENDECAELASAEVICGISEPTGTLPISLK